MEPNSNACADMLTTICDQAESGLSRAVLRAKFRMAFKELKDLPPTSEERVARELLPHGATIDVQMLQDALCISRMELRAFRKHDPYPAALRLKYDCMIVSAEDGFEWAVQALNELGGWDGLAERRAALLATKARPARKILGPAPAPTDDPTIHYVS